MSKNIIVIGALGLIGSHICDRLAANGEYNVQGVDDESFGKLSNLQCGIDFHLMDFNDLHYEFLGQYDVMVFSACYNIIASMKNPKRSYQVNATNAAKLFKKFHGKIVNLGTSSVYGPTKILPTPETAEINCTEVYSESKYVAELALHRRQNYTNLRLSNVYSHRQSPDNPNSGVVGRFIGANLLSQPMTINGRGEATRDFNYVEDVVAAVMLAIESPALNTSVNIGTGIETSISTLTEIIAAATGKRNTTNFTTERTIDNITRRCLDNRKALKLLGWKPKTSLQDGIKKTVKWMQQELITQIT